MRERAQRGYSPFTACVDYSNGYAIHYIVAISFISGVDLTIAPIATYKTDEHIRSSFWNTALLTE